MNLLMMMFMTFCLFLDSFLQEFQFTFRQFSNDELFLRHND